MSCRSFRRACLNDFGDYLWQRALLSKGDYTLKKSKNNSFLVDGNDRDISWKRLLRDDNEKRNYLKSLFDEINVETVKEDLQKIIEEFKLRDLRENFIWRKYLTERPQILDVCGKNKFIRFNNYNDILLLEKSQTNGIHREFYSYALMVRLKKLGNQVSYFYQNSVGYYPRISQVNNKHISIKFHIFNGRWSYNIKVANNDDLYFKTEQEVIDYLLENSFISKKSE